MKLNANKRKNTQVGSSCWSKTAVPWLFLFWPETWIGQVSGRFSNRCNGPKMTVSKWKYTGKESLNWTRHSSETNPLQLRLMETNLVEMLLLFDIHDSFYFLPTWKTSEFAYFCTQTQIRWFFGLRELYILWLINLRENWKENSKMNQDHAVKTVLDTTLLR